MTAGYVIISHQDAVLFLHPLWAIHSPYACVLCPLIKKNIIIFSACSLFSSLSFRGYICTPLSPTINLSCGPCCMVWLCETLWLQSSKISSVVKSLHGCHDSGGSSGGSSGGFFFYPPPVWGTLGPCTQLPCNRLTFWLINLWALHPTPRIGKFPLLVDIISFLDPREWPLSTPLVFLEVKEPPAMFFKVMIDTFWHHPSLVTSSHEWC